MYSLLTKYNKLANKINTIVNNSKKLISHSCLSNTYQSNNSIAYKNINKISHNSSYLRNKNIIGINKSLFSTNTKYNQEDVKRKISDIPLLKDFINNKKDSIEESLNQEELIEINPVDYYKSNIATTNILNNKTYLLESFGCQMNSNDAEIVKAILNKSGLVETLEKENADIILFNTCSIREAAEERVIERIKQLKQYKNSNKDLIVGVLGCMAENKKGTLQTVKNKFNKDGKTLNLINLVAGPDSYRELPKMISALMTKESKFEINTQLSIEETYGDIMPVRVKDNLKAFVSIMRGCNNMCTYCIVPFTRGVERSRDSISIFNEIKELNEQGIKEVTLLGQNVNSYFVSNNEDIDDYYAFISQKFSEEEFNYIKNESKKQHYSNTELKQADIKDFLTLSEKVLADGFDERQSKAKVNDKKGLRFHQLLFYLSESFPNIKFRFTSPHPKDYPDALIKIIAYQNNVSKGLHIPLQSGNTEILTKMKRFYSKESYINLIEKIREVIPKAKISSDFIVGFCGETEDQFLDTLDVCRKVNFDVAYMFMYSMRPKTYAYHKFVDNVTQEDKSQRLTKLIEVIFEGQNKNNTNEIGKEQLVLVEGLSKKNNKDEVLVYGKNDGYITCVINNIKIGSKDNDTEKKELTKGDWAVVVPYKATATTLYCNPLYRIQKLNEFKI